MAEQNTETIKDVLRGFSTMQYHLGLSPMATGTQPMGVQLLQPPPPPQIPHPSEAAQQAFQQQQMLMQQTMAAAQMTRYQPPPSAPAFSSTWQQSMGAVQAGAANPYFAQMMGGMPGMPSPGMMTSPMFGGYRPPPMMGGLGLSSVPQVPISPFAPGVAAAHFSTPALQQLQITRAYQAQGVAGLAGIMQGGLGIAGSILGTGLGTMLGGPLGGLAGGFLGERAGAGLAGLGIGPALSDITRGRQLQNTTAPFMVSGASLDPYTGQGMSRQAGVQTASLIRHMSRDFDFQRTGFNTQDVMRITQLASDQGLLQTAQNPEQIANQVKSISKAVKALVQITGDPDVKNAIASLGQMRLMGFEGMTAMTGAVANRATFARMGGISQGAMAQLEAAGAMQAQQMGLAGAVGVRSAQFGAGMANMALGTGAVGGVLLGQIGGQQGMQQILSQAQSAAVGFDPMLMAAVGAGGKSVDIEAYRRLKGQSLESVMHQAGQRMGQLGPQGLLEFTRRRKEFASRIAQQMSPEESMMLPLEQARMLQQSMGGPGQFSLGSAFQAMGMDEASAQATAQMYGSRQFWQGMQQQNRVRQRAAADRERARREEFRTPSLFRRMGRGIAGALGDASDAIEQPFAAGFEHLQRVEEENAALARGERIERFRPEELVRTEQDRTLARAGRSGMGRILDITRGQGGGGGGLLNLAGASLGLSTLSNDNQRRRLVAEALGAGEFGQRMGISLGSRQTEERFLTGVGRAGEMVSRAQRAGVSDSMLADVHQRLQGGTKGGQVDPTQLMQKVKSKLLAAIPEHSFGGADPTLSAGAVDKAWVDTLVENGWTQHEAEAVVARNSTELGSAAVGEVMRGGASSKQMATLMNTLNIKDKLGSMSSAQGMRDAAQQNLERAFADAGFIFKEGTGGQAMRSKIAQALGSADTDLVARAILRRGGATAQEQLAKMNAGMSAQQRIAVAGRAEAEFAKLPDDVRQQMMQVGRRGVGSIAGNLMSIKAGVGAGKAVQQATGSLQSLAAQYGLQGSPEELVRQLGGMDLGAGFESFKAAAQKGDTAGALSALADMDLGGALGTTEVRGGVQSEETQRMKGSEKTFGEEAAKAADKLDDVADKLGQTIEKLNTFLDSHQTQGSY